MGQAKIQLTVGGISFSGEGEQEWLEKQLHDILEAIPTLTKIEIPLPAGEVKTVGQPSDSDGEGESFNQSLGVYIRQKGGDSNQQMRFLATADWLRRRGNNDLKTSMVTAALREGHQKKIGNPADCLNNAVRRGFCEKNGSGFFITPEGMKSLGHE